MYCTISSRLETNPLLEDRILYQILRHDLDPVYLGLDRRYRRDVLGDVQFVALALNYWAEDLDWLRDAESLQLLDVGYTTFRMARNIDQGANQLVFGETHHLTCKEKSALKKKGLERLVCRRLDHSQLTSISRSLTIIKSQLNRVHKQRLKPSPSQISRRISKHSSPPWSPLPKRS